MTIVKALPDTHPTGYFGTIEAPPRADWHGNRPLCDSSITPEKSPSTARSRKLTLRVPALSRGNAAGSALFMSETIDQLNIGAHFLNRLSGEEKSQLRDMGRQIVVRQGETVFTQGEQHEGIFIIERGQVRVYYSAPSGREITLAYWTPGHFIGGPEISGGGPHMWSGTAIDDCQILVLPSNAVEKLLARMPNFALALIDGLVAKGKCYSSMAQMLGTRSVIERLAQYLLNLSELYGSRDGDAIVINRKITHDQIAAMVGSTRQWVTMMLKRFQTKHIIAIEGSVIRVKRPDLLEKILFKD
jgi:CRP/FNR family cyclic AMP-dependent transcriptional regulator